MFYAYDSGVGGGGYADQIFIIEIKRRNLDEFTSGMHTDVETLVDDPFEDITDALAYLYESIFRKLESTFDKSSKEYKDAKATLDRMQQHLYGYDMDMIDSTRL